MLSTRRLPMTDWKMPEWMREVWEYIYKSMPNLSNNAKEFNIRESIKRTEGEMNDIDVDWCDADFAEVAREKRLLSTPSERDANDKRIAELEAEVERLRNRIKRMHDKEDEFLSWVCKEIDVELKKRKKVRDD